MNAHASTAAAPLDLTELVLRLDRPGPRYTSYPPADRFATTFTEADAAAALTRADVDAPLSVYVHLPHCHRLCGYCACNVVPTKSMSRRASYIDLLLAELELAATHLPRRRRLGQLHFGGGTPNSYPVADLQRLVSALFARFTPTESAELAIEIDPRYVTDDQMAGLAGLGLNRISFGVQDFDLDVQRAIGRHQSVTQTVTAVELARRHGFGSVNIDMVYGLPRQTLTRLSDTLDKLVTTRPDRIALFAFAYLPEQRKNQRGIDKDELPDAPTRARMLVLARERLMAAGYVAIGMDHFALPHDSLATAERDGRLRRNFQGYTVAPRGEGGALEVLGLGLSAISDLGGAYIQNTKEIEAYDAAVSAGHLPIERGHTLTRDDAERRALIERLMTGGSLPASAFAALGLELEDRFPGVVAELTRLEGEGLVRIERDGHRARGVSLTELGALFPRRVAMCFDARAIGPDAAQAMGRYSRIV